MPSLLDGRHTSRVRKDLVTQRGVASNVMEEFSKTLKQLAVKAQQYPAKSLERQQALAALLAAMQGKLYRPRQGQFPGFYEEIYAEAEHRLFSFLCERIDTYDPEQDFLAWANFLLSRRFFNEVAREVRPPHRDPVASASPAAFTEDDLSGADLEAVSLQAAPSLVQEIKQCLEDDPDGIFQAAFVMDNPAANFQFLALQRLSGCSWKEISAELGITISTLSSFYERSLARFAVRIREYVSR